MLRTIENLLSSRLGSEGFKKRSAGILTKEVKDGFVGWLGLNSVKHKRGVEINPVVGVRCNELERILAMILQEKPHSYVPPTVSISLGYLMPERKYHSWTFAGNVDEATFSDLTKAILRYGVPFMEVSSTINNIDSLLQSPKFAHMEHAMYRLPLAKWLSGDAEGALKACDHYCRELGQRVDMVAERFKKFAAQIDSIVNDVNAKPDSVLRK